MTTSHIPPRLWKISLLSMSILIAFTSSCLANADVVHPAKTHQFDKLTKVVSKQIPASNNLDSKAFSQGEHIAINGNIGKRQKASAANNTIVTPPPFFAVNPFTFLAPGFTQELVGVSSGFFTGVAFAPDGDPIVSNYNAGRFIRFDLQGTPQRSMDLIYFLSIR